MLNNALALCFFIKKMTRKNNEVDVELGQEAQPAAVGLAGAAVAAAIPGSQDEIDEGMEDPISPMCSSPPEVSLLSQFLYFLTILMINTIFLGRNQYH